MNPIENLLDEERIAELLDAQGDIVKTAEAVPCAAFNDAHISAQAMAAEIVAYMQASVSRAKQLGSAETAYLEKLSAYAENLQAHHLDILDAAASMPRVDLFSHAIAALQLALEVAENNEPISRADGDVAQADLQAKIARSLKFAIARLERP